MSKTRVVIYSDTSGKGYSSGEAAIALALGAAICAGIGYGVKAVQDWWKKRK